MPKKKDNLPPVHSEEIILRAMEDVMHDSMMPYSEHVILERALPRVEDGLKPVQRRILYTMHELGNTPDKPHRKCARIVGDCLGKYHPHGDSSVYDALARMAQPFVMRAPLVDGHGNFGSIDGDAPAAMRYTEARMTSLAMVLLQDIDKDTVDFHLNFDDTLKEPDLLPGHFPNLLVNGANGIAVGLATNIPPHNMGEVIDGTIALIDDPDITTSDLMKTIQAPDFPTGGLLAADGELVSAYETGRGRVQVRAKLHIEDAPGGKHLIVIDEIPYQINKSAMLEKILHLSEEKKTLLSGISDIRDESDRTGLRAVIELKRDADVQKTLNVLYKYSDLQVTFGINMVAIAGGKPRQMGLKEILTHYIAHQKNVTTRRTKYELQQAELRAHILEGLIIAVDNLDEVIRLIRSSKNPKEAKERLMARFALSDVQAQAILDMRLQRLTNLEILSLRKEYAELEKRIAMLKGILASEKKLMNVIKKELLTVRETFADARRTEIVGTFEEITIEKEQPVADETLALVTNGGFVKRMSPKLYERFRANGELPEWPRFAVKAMTDEKLWFITDRGQCYPVPLTMLPEARIRERGLAVGGLLAGLESDEKLVNVLRAGEQEESLLLVTRMGTVKRVTYADLNVRKSRFSIINLKEDDRLVSAQTVGTNTSALLITSLGMALNFALDEVSAMGRAAAGVKGITLSTKDAVAFAFVHENEGEIILCSDLGYMKRCLLIDFDRHARGGKGAKAFPFAKGNTNGHSVCGAMAVTVPCAFRVMQQSGAFTAFNSEDVTIEPRTSNGTPYVIVLMNDFICGLTEEGR